VPADIKFVATGTQVPRCRRCMGDTLPVCLALSLYVPIFGLFYR